MPAQVAAAAGAAGGQPAQQGGGNPLMGIMRMVMLYYFINNYFFKKPAITDPALLSRNMFQKGEEVDMWVYLTESPRLPDLKDESQLVWAESNIPYGLYVPDAKRSLDIEYQPSTAVTERNGSVWAHLFFARSGFPIDNKDPAFDRQAVFFTTHPLVVYFPRPKNNTKKKLLGSGEEGDTPKWSMPGSSSSKSRSSSNGGGGRLLQGEEEEEDGMSGLPREWVGFWRPNLTITLIDDFTAYPKTQIPDIFRQHMSFDPATGNYFPTVSVSTFWLLRDKLLQLNSSLTGRPLSLSMSVETLSLWRWQMYLAMEQSFAMQQAYGAAMESEADELKRVFLEGNPILLAVTLVVSLLHSVFDFLAFKNDIQFWNSNKSMEGLSARSIVINFVCQVIVFLYLLDNETSWMIIISAGVSCAIEFWKIGKAMDVQIDRSGPIPLLRFRDRDSYSANKTREYDELAMRYLSYALYPLVIGYAIYSLTYETHKSWYSWILSSLTGCVYTFGFIMMCPQLFINYKLKSVAHLPWRQMTYKFLNTIVDDLFAFVIKMPTLHRLSVFRDDIVFLILLYQRWSYPVDKKRVNEFGYAGEQPADPAGAPAAIEAESEGGSADAAADSATTQLLDGEPQPATSALPAGEGSESGAKVGVSEEGLKRRKKGGEKDVQENGKETGRSK